MNYVYILTNRNRSVLYTGVTSNLPKRIAQHKQKSPYGFTGRYNVDRLIYYEAFSDIREAIRREKQIKGWSRRRKEALISTLNPNWAEIAVLQIATSGLRPSSQ